MRSYRMALLVGVLLIGGSVALCSELTSSWYPRPTAMNVSLEVLVDGQPVPTIYHQGKTYLPVSRVGAEYEIRVSNRGPRRIAAVVSVDGLSVISGRAASGTSPGYLVEPGGSILIEGWRRDRATVAAFRFVDREASYASRMGHPENVGVIGLVAHEEQAPLLLPRPYLEKTAPARSFAKEDRAAVGGIGTEYGRDINAPVYYVPFVRSGHSRHVTFYYDTAEALRAAGVPVHRMPPVPFPADPEFAPPPPGPRGK